MSNVLSSLEPKAVWRIFEQICNIPHPSKKEKAIAEYVVKFGKDLGLETLTDPIGNVLIRKPASPGMENRQTIILQGHLDMVPQKNNDTAHDFEKDPIKPFIDGEWVKAKGTTLGADNGIGSAAAMAVLEDKSLVHGPIECLFTIDEETGMTGAFNLQAGFLKGDILMNLDSEDEGELYIGCAGGMDTTVEFKYKEEAIPAGSEAFRIDVKGLKGGHSGIDIILGRGNANKLINRILWHGFREHKLRLASIEGGSLRNAIPREAIAIITLPKEEIAKFKKCFDKLVAEILNEYKSVEPDMAITISNTNMPAFVMDANTTRNLLNSIYACPNGVSRMVADMPGVVETSNNLAIIKSDKGVIQIAALQRSSVDSAKEELGHMIRSVFEMANADMIEHSGSYPGWKPNVDSPILKAMKEGYKAKFGKTPEVKVIHAGLECGIIGGVYPNLDMISFGPTIRHPHSPDEKVNIKTVGLFYDFLLETLKNAPLKNHA